MGNFKQIDAWINKTVQEKNDSIRAERDFERVTAQSYLRDSNGQRSSFIHHYSPFNHA